MKEAFKSIRFGDDKLKLIAIANEIIERYQDQGLRLTLRQLYYQFVTQNHITNEERSYKNLGKLISDARLAGLVDWDAIEDRVRVPVNPPEFDSLRDLVDAALRSYRLPRWEGQDCYAELWVEKDALSGVLRPLAYEYHVTLMVNKGYSSQSAMREAGRRFVEQDQKGRRTLLFYLGDHDPSGEDMVRDIQDRLTLFGSEVEVVKIALTMEQITQYNPPPNPAKMSDSRAQKYVAKHGAESWEVDALPPEALQHLIREALNDILDREAMDAIVTRENKEKELLRVAAANIK